MRPACPRPIHSAANFVDSVARRGRKFVDNRVVPGRPGPVSFGLPEGATDTEAPAITSTGHRVPAAQAITSSARLGWGRGPEITSTVSPAEVPSGASLPCGAGREVDPQAARPAGLIGIPVSVRPLGG
jgi:hypothetical protein